MPYAPFVPHYPSDDPDVRPTTPHGPGDWPETHELMIGIGEIKDMTPADDTIYLEYEPVVHLHPGPLGFAPRSADAA